jgi:hypothetical protein
LTVSSCSSSSLYIRIVSPILAGGHPGAGAFIFRRGDSLTRGVSGSTTMVSSGHICSDDPIVVDVVVATRTGLRSIDPQQPRSIVCVAVPICFDLADQRVNNRFDSAGGEK